MLKTKAVLQLIRPINDMMVGLAVIIGYIISQGNVTTYFNSNVVYGFITGFFISASIMALNDVIDLPIDKINRPDRPIPSGLLSVKSAIIIGLLCFIIGIQFSLLTGILTFIVALIFWIIGLLYNLKFKGTPLLGNLLVSLSISIPFIYGGLIINPELKEINTFLLALTAFTINTYREIIKDIADKKGDKELGLSTLPIKIGDSKAFYIASIFLLIGLATGWIPIFIDTGLNITIYTILLILSEALILKSWWDINKNGFEEKNLIKAKKLCMIGMFIGMLAFLFGRVTEIII